MDVKTVQLVLEKSKKRRFPQTFELIVNLKPTYDLRKSENVVVDYVELPKGRGKKVRVAAIVGPELEKVAKEIFDEVITKENLKEFAQDKRKAKEFAKRN
ncbi:MAG TPA: 50S ribosomal protein L1, partial [Candidatus Nanopusillus sp.]|nr:50S ribosomal protein L1 [Candidatus Nanopusillus sp.]